MIFKFLIDIFFNFVYPIVNTITFQFEEFVDITILNTFIAKGLYFFDSSVLLPIMVIVSGIIIFRFGLGVVIWIYEHIPFIG